jgi:hypothetical protein
MCPLLRPSTVDVELWTWNFHVLLWASIHRISAAFAVQQRPGASPPWSAASTPCMIIDSAFQAASASASAHQHSPRRNDASVDHQLNGSPLQRCTQVSSFRRRLSTAALCESPLCVLCSACSSLCIPYPPRPHFSLAHLLTTLRARHAGHGTPGRRARTFSSRLPLHRLY